MNRRSKPAWIETSSWKQSQSQQQQQRPPPQQRRVSIRRPSVPLRGRVGSCSHSMLRVFLCVVCRLQAQDIQRGARSRQQAHKRTAQEEERRNRHMRRGTKQRTPEKQLITSPPPRAARTATVPEKLHRALQQTKTIASTVLIPSPEQLRSRSRCLHATANNKKQEKRVSACRLEISLFTSLFLQRCSEGEPYKINCNIEH